MKKVLFFIITILMGFMLLVTTYQGFYMSQIQGMIQESLDNKDYDTLAKSFVPFFNKDEVNYDCNEGMYDIISYEAVIGEPIKVKDGDKELDANKYAQAYVFFIDDIKFNLEGIKQGDKFNNFTNLTLSNGDKKYVYYFNEPTNATGPDDKDVKRFYTTAAKELEFVMISINKSVIDKELGGKITKLEVNDGTGKLVGSVNCDLDFDSSFFTTTNEVVQAYDKYLEKFNDKAAQDEYAKFYDEWYKKYTANENYGLAYLPGEISLTSTYLKTGGVMLAYVIICIALGYFVLRKKANFVTPTPKNTPYKPKGSTEKEIAQVTTKDANTEKKEETIGETQQVLENEEVAEDVSEEVEISGEESSTENL